MMSLEALKQDTRFQCLVRYLVLVVDISALQALRALITTFADLINMYIQYSIIDKIDTELENFLMKLKLEPLELFLQNVNNVVNQIANLMPPGDLIQCTGAGEIMDQFYAGVFKIKAMMGVASEIGSRYKIAGLIETSFSENLKIIQVYIELYLYLIDEAIAAKASGMVP